MTFVVLLGDNVQLACRPEGFLSPSGLLPFLEDKLIGWAIGALERLPGFAAQLTHHRPFAGREVALMVVEEPLQAGRLRSLQELAQVAS